MKLKLLVTILAAALSVLACAPGTVKAENDSQNNTENQGGDDNQGGQDNPPQEHETEVSIYSAGEISSTGATLYGSYEHASAVPEYKGFEWGTSRTNLSEDIQSASEPDGESRRFSATLTGLSYNTEYFFRAYIKVLENGSYQTYYSSVGSFRTEKGGEGPQTASQPGWFEVPVVNALRNSDGYLQGTDNTDLYYAYHKSDIGTRNYTVCYNGAYHCPVWVAAPRHPIYSTGSGRSGYSFDPDIPKDVQQASTSGSTSGYNRGHMLGSAERTGSDLTNKQVFYVTNIAPQGNPWFNSDSGGWNPLEKFIDKFETRDTLYVVIGAYFEDYTDAYGNKADKKTALFMGSTVQIPTMFYYACMRTKSGTSGKSLKNCSRDEIMCAAFVRAHSEGTAGQAVTKKEMMSIDQLEKITGFDYFPSVPNAPEDSFNPSDWGL